MRRARQHRHRSPHKMRPAVSDRRRCLFHHAGRTRLRSVRPQLGIPLAESPGVPTARGHRSPGTHTPAIVVQPQIALHVDTDRNGSECGGGRLQPDAQATVADEHDLIVQPDVFQKVQTLLLRRACSATIFFSRAFSFSRALNCFAISGCMPPYFCRQR